MPPLSWQNAEDIGGYATEDHSPLFQSPFVEPWNTQAPNSKDPQGRYWNPMPFPKWQFHLNTSSPKQFKSEHMKDASIRSGSIFINDSPVGSCSVISISSSSEEDQEASQNEMKDVSMINVKPAYSFVAQTPSPVTRVIESKKDLPKLSSNNINDSNHYTAVRPKRSRIIPMLQDATSNVQSDSTHVVGSQTSNRLALLGNRNPLARPPDNHSTRREECSPDMQNNMLHGARFRPKCFNQNPAASSNRRYYDQEFQFSRFSADRMNLTAKSSNDCCTNPLQMRESCTRCYTSATSSSSSQQQQPIHPVPNHHLQMAHYVPFPTGQNQVQVPPITVHHGPPSHNGIGFPTQQNTRNASSFNVPNYSSFTYFSK